MKNLFMNCFSPKSTIMNKFKLNKIQEFNTHNCHFLNSINMYPKYLFSGKENGYANSIQFKYFNGILLVIYASANTVIISTWENEVKQIIYLENKQDVKSVSFSSINGKLVIAQNDTLFFYQPELLEDNKFYKWIEESQLKQEEDITQVNWIYADKLLVCGNSAKIFKIKNNKLIKYWEESSSSNILIADISPDNNWLALTHQHDRLVKVWKLNDIESKDDSPPRVFCYLKHPRSVLSLSWHKSMTSENIPILFTCCADGIFRCWTNSSQTYKDLFYLCTTIDPSQWSTSKRSKQTHNEQHKECESSYENIKEKQMIPNAQFHWIDSNIVGELALLEKNRIQLLKQKNIFNFNLNDIEDNELNILNSFSINPPVLIFQIQNDNSLVLWKLDGIDVMPYSSPNVTVIAKIPNAINCFKYNNYFSSCFVTINPLSIELKEQNYPIEFSILIQNEDYHIEHFTIGLSQILFSSYNGNVLNSLSTWAGHKTNIIKIVAYKNWFNSNMSEISNKVLTLSDSCEIAIWQTLYQSDINKNFAQTHITNSKLIQPIDADWLNEDYLVILEKSKCYLYHIENECVNSRLIPMQINELSSEFKYLKIIKLNINHFLIFALINENNDQPSSYLSWKIKLSDKNTPSITLEPIQQLPINIDNNIYCFLNESTNYDDNENNIITLVYYDKLNNNLSYWCNELQNDPWEQKFNYLLQFDNVNWIKSGPNNLLLIRGNKNNEFKLSILNLQMWTFDIVEEYKLDWNGDEIVDIDWLPTSFNYPTLVVASLNYIKVFSFCSLNKVVCWKLCSTMSIPKIDVISSNLKYISVSLDGSICLIFGSYLYYLGKWIPNNEMSLDGMFELTMPHKNTLINTMHSLSGKNQPIVSTFHPKFVLGLVEWGEFDLVNQIILHIEEFISHQDLFDEDSKLIIPPFNFEFFLKQEDNNNNEIDSLLDQPLFSNNKKSTVLSNHQYDTMLSKLSKHPIEGLSKQNQDYLVVIFKVLKQVLKLKSSLDGLGLLYLFNANLNHYTNVFSLSSVNYITAFHSQSHDLLINQVLELDSEPINWEKFKSLGLTYWIKEDDILKKQIEKLARNQYLKDKDPTECSLLYFALNKTKLLLSLWKASTYHKDHQIMVKFLGNDFNLIRWKTAAQKNAFKLIGLQRYHYAAAFFLLAGKLTDAVNICLKYLNDWQLAFVLCRCYEGSYSDTCQKLINDTLLIKAFEDNDSYMVSILLWYIDKKQLSIDALYHPLPTIKDNLGLKIQSKTINSNQKLSIFNKLHKSLSGFDVDADLYSKLTFNSVLSYLDHGLPTLALLVLNGIEIEDKTEDKQVEDKQDISSSLDWDWSTPSNKKKDDSTTKDIFAEYDNNRTKDIFADYNNPLSSNLAIASGIIDFDDWSFGNNNISNNTSSNLMNFKNQYRVKQSNKIKLSKLQKLSLNRFQQHVLLLLLNQVSTCLYQTQESNMLPKSLIFEYLDKVKNSINLISEQYKLSPIIIDFRLVYLSQISEDPILAFDLLFQGLLSTQIDSSIFVVSFNINCWLFFNNTFEDTYLDYYNPKEIIEYSKYILNSFNRWSITIMLNKDFKLANQSIVDLILFIFIIFIINLIKIRDYHTILIILKSMQDVINALFNDLDHLQTIVKKLCAQFDKIILFEDTNDLNLDLNLDFEMDSNLKIIYKDGKTTSENLLSINPQSIQQEVIMFKKVLCKLVYFINQIVKNDNNINLNFNKFLLPLFKLIKLLDANALPGCFIKPNDLLLDTFIIAKDFDLLNKWLN